MIKQTIVALIFECGGVIGLRGGNRQGIQQWQQ
ncbi:hypothetical protein HmCmsJML234_01729 [Escherichia coli]|nr:hypothetical protein HmCmsJML234_01729 [Escherichia coli]